MPFLCAVNIDVSMLILTGGEVEMGSAMRTVW